MSLISQAIISSLMIIFIQNFKNQNSNRHANVQYALICMQPGNRTIVMENEMRHAANPIPQVCVCVRFLD